MSGVEILIHSKNIICSPPGNLSSPVELNHAKEDRHTCGQHFRGSAGEKAGPSDHPSPFLADHLNFLTFNVQEGSVRTGQGW